MLLEFSAPCWSQLCGIFTQPQTKSPTPADHNECVCPKPVGPQQEDKPQIKGKKTQLSEPYSVGGINNQLGNYYPHLGTSSLRSGLSTPKLLSLDQTSAKTTPVNPSCSLAVAVQLCHQGSPKKGAELQLSYILPCTLLHKSCNRCFRSTRANKGRFQLSRRKRAIAAIKAGQARPALTKIVTGVSKQEKDRSSVQLHCQTPRQRAASKGHGSCCPSRESGGSKAPCPPNGGGRHFKCFA